MRTEKKIKIAIIVTMILVTVFCIADRIAFANTGMGLIDNAKAYAAEKFSEGVDDMIDYMLYGEEPVKTPEYSDSSAQTYNGF